MEQKIYKPVVLAILDGFGIPKDESRSGITRKNTKFLQELATKYPTTVLEASGEYVGLPSYQTGTSDIGHLTIGTGRVNFQPLVRIEKAIKDGSFYTNPAIIKACDNAKKNGHALHLFGIVSNGGVHAQISHLFELLKVAKQQNVKNVFLHIFTDGRDTPQKSSPQFIAQLNEKIKEIGVGKIATVCGRYYALDRDRNYDRNKLAYDAIVYGKGREAKNALEAVENAYKAGETDEFIIPTVVTRCGKPIATVRDGDSVIFANYRADRERQLTYIFVENNDLDFVKKMNLCFVTMVNYDNTFKNPIVAFDEIKIENTLSEVVSQLGIRQAKIAETEKYAYVTFAFNAGKQDTYKGEERFLVPSKKVKTFDLAPEMSAREITNIAKTIINSKEYGLVVLNLANGDMVGHSGNKIAARKAVEVVDDCVHQLVDATLKNDGSIFICADHGNCDIMEYEDGTPHTSHTMAQVPAFLVSNCKYKLKKHGSLPDVAPTILQLLNIKQPKEMTGKSLID